MQYSECLQTEQILLLQRRTNTSWHTLFFSGIEYSDVTVAYSKNNMSNSSSKQKAITSVRNFKGECAKYWSSRLLYEAQVCLWLDHGRAGITKDLHFRCDSGVTFKFKTHSQFTVFHLIVLVATGCVCMWAVYDASYPCFYTTDSLWSGCSGSLHIVTGTFQYSY